jgi:chromosome segregation ATPase
MNRLPWEMKAQSLISENRTLKEKLAPIEKRLEEENINEQNLNIKLQDSIEELDKVRQELKTIKEGAAEYLDLKKKHDRAQRNPSRWDSRETGMKFDDVTQWVIPNCSGKSHLAKA